MSGLGRDRDAGPRRADIRRVRMQPSFGRALPERGALRQPIENLSKLHQDRGAHGIRITHLVTHGHTIGSDRLRRAGQQRSYPPERNGNEAQNPRPGAEFFFDSPTSRERTVNELHPLALSTHADTLPVSFAACRLCRSRTVLPCSKTSRPVGTFRVRPRAKTSKHATPTTLSSYQPRCGRAILARSGACTFGSPKAACVSLRALQDSRDKEIPPRKLATQILDRASLSAGAMPPVGYRLFTKGLCHTRSIALCWMECLAVTQNSVTGRRHSIPHGTPTSQEPDHS